MTAALAAIQAISSETVAPVAMKTATAAPSLSTPAEWLTQQIQIADAQIKTADASVQKLALGQDVELHRVMLDIEQARMSFDLVVQVRNRLVEAYTDIARLQV